jgi:hypothetical protein
MSSILLSIYSIIVIAALLCAGYNWMYKREIQRTEKQVGIAIPASFFQLLTALSFISLGIAGIATVMMVVSFLYR